MGDLTKNFSASEFVVSEEHPECLPEIRQSLTPVHFQKFYTIARSIVEPGREYIAGPIKTLSGVRDERLNFLAGGADGSDHRYQGVSGALDFKALTPEITLKLYCFLAHYLPPTSFGQLIAYPVDKEIAPSGILGSGLRFIHASLPTERHVGERLVKRASKYFNVILPPAP